MVSKLNPEPEKSQVAWIILNAVKNLHVGKLKLALFLKGSQSKNVKYIAFEEVFGGLMWYDIQTIIGFIEQLETIGLIQRKVHSEINPDYSIIELSDAGIKVLEEKIQIALQIIKRLEPITVGDSEKETLKLIRDGKPVQEIAMLRNLSEPTIYTHLFRLIFNRYISSHEVISEEIIKKITDATKGFKTNPSVKNVKELLPDIDYGEIRCVLAELKQEK